MFYITAYTSICMKITGKNVKKKEEKNFFFSLACWLNNEEMGRIRKDSETEMLILIKMIIRYFNTLNSKESCFINNSLKIK